MKISEIPALTKEQKQQFWRLGQKIWHLSTGELCENIARNVVFTLQYYLNKAVSKKHITLHWCADLPVQLLFAVIRHLNNIHITPTIRWKGAPASKQKLPEFITSLFNKKPPPDTVPFPVYFIEETHWVDRLKEGMAPQADLREGLITVLPVLGRQNATCGMAIPTTTAILMLDFPVVDFMNMRSSLPGLKAYLGNTGIPLNLVHRLGIQVENIFAPQSVINLDSPGDQWPGRACSGIVLE